MPYEAEIGSKNPTCFLFLVDQSGSMRKPWVADSAKTKAQGVADALNRLLQALVYRCARGEHVLDRYFIGEIGYGGDEDIGLGFLGDLAGDVLQPVSRIATHPLRLERRTRKVDDGAGGLVEQAINFPIWFEAIARGRTPMCKALVAAHQVIAAFVAQYPDCFPPIVINISDGAATDGYPEQYATALRGMASSDGNVLLFNLHISECGVQPLLFPTREEMLTDPYARMLFRMSSPLPPAMLDQARMAGFSVAQAQGGSASTPTWFPSSRSWISARASMRK